MKSKQNLNYLEVVTTTKSRIRISRNLPKVQSFYCDMNGTGRKSTNGS